jgi:hypothetical protein
MREMRSAASIVTCALRRRLVALKSSYGNNRSPVSASSTKIALTGQFSAASKIFSILSPSGLTTADWRFSFSRNVFVAIVSHIAFPTQIW